MTHIIDGMVAIAEGSSPNVKRWSEKLRKASIQYAITHDHYDDPSVPLGHAELWVEEDDADKARAAIQGKDQENP